MCSVHYQGVIFCSNLKLQRPQFGPDSDEWTAMRKEPGWLPHSFHILAFHSTSALSQFTVKEGEIEAIVKGATVNWKRCSLGVADTHISTIFFLGGSFVKSSEISLGLFLRSNWMSKINHQHSHSVCNSTFSLHLSHTDSRPATLCASSWPGGKNSFLPVLHHPSYTVLVGASSASPSALLSHFPLDFSPCSLSNSRLPVLSTRCSSICWS